MQPQCEESLFEYAVIRFVPKIEREEFFNIGVIMMCKRRKWIRMKCSISASKWDAFNSSFMKSEISNAIESWSKIVEGDAKSGDIAMLEPEERFRWLTAVKSTCLQTSRPHPGTTHDLEKTFDNLFEELVE